RRRIEGGDVLDVSVNFPAGRIGAGSLECGCDASNKAVAIFCPSLPAIDPPRPRRRRFSDSTQFLKLVTRHPTHCHPPPQTPALAAPRPQPSRNSRHARPPKDRIGNSDHSAAPCPDTSASTCPGTLSEASADVQSRRSKPA